ARPQFPTLGPAALLDQRAVMLDDLARGFDALGVDRAFGLGEWGGADPLGLVDRLKRVQIRHCGLGRGLIHRNRVGLGRISVRHFIALLPAPREGENQTAKPDTVRFHPFRSLATPSVKLRSFRQYNREQQGEFPWPTTTAPTMTARP